ncbi:hypothetical protein [Streptomyces sp. NPDC052036]|uniref:hypothetical protein n=1 Tax=unclassified Streptomyces TaxID=2593676 RepID=UPI0034425F88
MKRPSSVHRAAARAVLTAGLERGERPPADRTVGRPAGGDVVDSCALAGQAADR